MKLSSRKQGWSRSDKSNILNSTISTPSSPSPSARLTSHVFMQRWTINSHISPIKWSLAPNAVGWQMLSSWRLMLKGDLLGSTAPLWATTWFDIVHSRSSPLFSQTVLLWVLEGTILERSVFLLSKTHRAKVVDAVLHQAVALRSLCKSIPHPFAGFISGLETESPFESVNPGKCFKHLPCFWLNAEQCYGWAVAVSFRLWNLGSVERVLLQLHEMLLLSPTICQFRWLLRYKACVPAWHGISTENSPVVCVVCKQNASFQVWRKYSNNLRKKSRSPLGREKKIIILFLANIKRSGDKGRGEMSFMLGSTHN